MESSSKSDLYQHKYLQILLLGALAN